MMIFHLRIVLELEYYIDAIYLIDLHRTYISLIINHIDRNFRIIHLLGETGQVQTHNLIDAAHRIIRIGSQSDVIDCQMLAVEHYLFFENERLVFDRSSILPQPDDFDRKISALKSISPVRRDIARRLAPEPVIKALPPP